MDEQKNRKSSLPPETTSLSAETELFSSLIELQYGLDVEKKLRKITQRVEWTKGWPEDKRAFWNAESFMWGHKIEKEKRELIAWELEFLVGGDNLDLGCGAYSYLSSTGFDISDKMLLLNDSCTKKITGDLEEKLPFKEGEFDSITSIFVLNYVRKYSQLLSEVKRVLSEKGTFVMVLWSKSLNDWQRQKEVNKFSWLEWKRIIEAEGFLVEFYEKEGIWFFKGRKTKIY